MTNFFTRFWQRIYAPDTKSETEADRLSALQQTAIRRRKEYAIVKEQATTVEAALLAPSRKLMEDADAAHVAALQRFNNKQTRQKSY